MGAFADFKINNNIGLSAYGRNKNIAEHMYELKTQNYQNKYEKQFAITRDGYDRMIEAAKQAYVGVENPNTEINKKVMGDVLSYAIPNVDPEYAREHVEDLMYIAT